MKKVKNSRKNLDVIQKLQDKGWTVYYSPSTLLWTLQGACLSHDGTKVVDVTIVAVSPTDAYVQQIGSDKFLLS